MEKRHGKQHLRSVTENRHGMRHGKHDLRSVMEKRHGKRHLLSVTERTVTEIVTQAASRKCVTENVMECVMT